jgi:MEDS: MEthanogen/methylotroph, DcmR Sensory domain
MDQNNKQGWQKDKANIFWGEIAPTDHVLQIYENDEVFLDTLTAFVGAGINSNDSCIVIATDDHLQALQRNLERHAIHVADLIADNMFIPLNAEEVLSRFMVKDWPDENLFNQTVSWVLRKARGRTNRKVRAFGEMVAILWARGNYAATVHLEHLWNKFCAKEAFCLFCAYPKIGFTENMADSVLHICSAHKTMVEGSHNQHAHEVFYKEIAQSRAI